MAEAVKGLLGKKVRMTQLFQEDGEVIPLTAIVAGPCVVTQIRTPEKEGYSAVQLGFQPVTKKRGLNKPQTGHFSKADVAPQKYLREFRLRSTENYQVGQELKADIFQIGERIDVTGVSKGRGFAGVVKRYHFRGGRRTHGSMFHRAPGSIGSSAYPHHVMKGRRLPGHMGAERVTVRNLEVVRIDVEKNMIFVRGAIPGASNGLLLLKSVARREG